MGNAFSPNGDGKNDTYKPKEYKSLVEFHATIFNRWGQKLYEWDDPAADGWDGKFNGRDVKQGVYFVLVKAKGADGHNYNIRKDVNLLRGYTETTNSSSTINE
jgi:gliding motility-associated-like protein